MFGERTVCGVAVLAVGLCAASLASADIAVSQVPGNGPATASQKTRDVAYTAWPRVEAVPATTLAVTFRLRGVRDSATQVVPIVLDWEDEDAGATIQELPPSPSSLHLVFTAFGVFGAWQLTHSARKLQFGNLPEWYHTGGPVQVGHATPFDLEMVAPPVCLFAQPLAPPRPFLNLMWEVASACRLQFTPLATAPRGPPARVVGFAALR